MSLVDANIVLRYVLDDHAELSPKAAEILERQTVTLPMEAACEVIYVLQKVYAVERQDIQQQLSRLLDEKLVSLDKPAIFLKALECYSTSTLDFVDTLLWAYHVIEGQEVFTFDRKLHQHIRRTGEQIA
ncbi:PIN domain-containing protein [Thiobaca trueperi]|uniref:Putative nucleic-acid-binding protein n=1 Tax=Thiobaca trueperi TaxID=127458 RepID=A0A4R3MTD6_9GAMM|nr:PIN domain-containing protein [Thiobaca trueperi]TCT19688.1 putative nucleic-acid-binding protein [Thiobaca trueperi]